VLGLADRFPEAAAVFCAAEIIGPAGERGFSLADASVGFLAIWFVLAGVGIGFVETAETAAVATHAPEEIRGSAFGLLAATQSLGNLLASGVAGILWTVVSPGVAFAWAACWMTVSLVTLLPQLGRERRSTR